MSVANFQALCDGFCEAANAPAPQLAPDDQGVMVFSTEIADVAVNIMHTQATHPDSAFVLIDFGPPPPEREAEALRTVLLINFTMLGVETASTFSIHPIYGHVTLQARYPFHGRSGVELLRSVRTLVAMALQWRETYFLQTPSQPASQLMSHHPGYADTAPAASA
ncbi:MAG: CesT family type III secretion system chaperone [Pseudomonadota bacterium]